MASDKYILKGKEPVPVDDLYAWASWFERADRVVANEIYKSGEDMVRVSTVFLGLNHAYGDGPPMLFETMVFGGKHDGDCYRYSTWEQAEEGHHTVARKICAETHATKGQ